MLLAFSWPPEAYLWFKTLHIVGVVVWFAGLFYLVRLFIYHREAAELEPPIRVAFEAQYSVMERRLANIITTPGMVVAVAMAVGLLSLLGQAQGAQTLDPMALRQEAHDIGASMGLLRERVDKDLSLYATNLEKMTQAVELMEETVAAERRRSERRLRTEPESVLPAAD